MLLGSIEAGGTKFVCAVGNEDYRTKDIVRFPTTTPEETLTKCIDYFKKFDDLKAIGISSFGPIESREKSGLLEVMPHCKMDFLSIKKPGN